MAACAACDPDRPRRLVSDLRLKPTHFVAGEVSPPDLKAAIRLGARFIIPAAA